MVDSETNLRGEVPKKVFLCVIAVVGKTLILTEKKELEVLPSLDHSLSACLFASRWVRAHCHGLERDRERESNLEKAAKEICSIGRPLFFFFRCTARRWPVINELFFRVINGAVDGTSGERFLTITFRISSVKCCVYFLVVCLFFPRSRIDFQKKLDEKHKKQTSCPYIGTAPSQHRDGFLRHTCNHCPCRELCRTRLTTAPRIDASGTSTESLFALETSCPVLHFVEAQVHSTSK